MRQSYAAPSLPAGAAQAVSSPSTQMGTMPTPSSYAIPFSPKLRASAQQPTYITPSTAAPNPLNPVYTPAPVQPQEEVCIECAMRDQDMADVDVTSPGIWARESDVAYEELLRRDEEDEMAGIANEDLGRARALLSHPRLDTPQSSPTIAEPPSELVPP